VTSPQPHASRNVAIRISSELCTCRSSGNFRLRTSSHVAPSSSHYATFIVTARRTETYRLSSRTDRSSRQPNALHSSAHERWVTCLFRHNLTVSSNLHYYVQKQVQLLSLLSMNKCIVFLQYLNKGFYSDILFIFISNSYIIILSIYLCSKLCFLSFMAPFCFTNPDGLFPQNYSGLARVYCIVIHKRTACSLYLYTCVLSQLCEDNIRLDWPCHSSGG
jgi:hypothetical protein